MATSDKESSRGNAGRDSNQSAEPASETQSREVAARPVMPLPMTTRAVRHESWLGICVIILLMFALAFLVYQKVERHERLAKVAIPAQGAAAASADADQPVAAPATADFTPAEAADLTTVDTSDPLQNVAEQSPFANAPPAFSDAEESTAVTELPTAAVEPSLAAEP